MLFTFAVVILGVLSNAYRRSVTFDTFQEPRFWLNPALLVARYNIVVTFFVFHPVMFVGFQFPFENKLVMFCTPLTSHAPRSQVNAVQLSNAPCKEVTVFGKGATYKLPDRPRNVNSRVSIE